MDFSKLKIPNNYGKYLDLFSNHKISFLLFKQTENINKEIGGLDVLFKTDKHYDIAKELLLSKDFIVYLSEKNEPYKTMLVKYEKEELIIFHLQRKISWLGITALNQEKMFNSIIPSKEDSLLIHAAHILFENYKISYEKEIFDEFTNKKLNYKYINSQLENFGWKQQFYSVINSKMKTTTIIKAHVNRFLRKDFLKLSYFISKQAIQFFTKRLNLRTKGLFISFDGVNGCGKSTLSKHLVQSYNEINKKLKLKSKYYYFGWVPLLPLTKCLSKISKNKKIYERAINEKTPQFSLKYELFFLYLFFDYLARYFVHIYPNLRKRQAVITDRSFYHIYGQYPYSRNSILMPFLINFFPKADFSFFIDASLKQLVTRRKDVTKENLLKQRENYLELLNLNKKTKILKPESVEETIKLIYETIWRKQFKKLKY